MRSKLVSATLLTLLMIACFAGFAYAAAPSFTLTATPVKSAYYLGEDVTINAKLAWDGLTSNYTVNMQLWNSTDVLETLESGVSITGENGTYSKTYTVSGITKNAGSAVFYIKAVEASTGLAIADAKVSFLVQDKSISMSVAWADASADRIVDPQESVTYTVYVSWAFVNETISATLKVQDQGMEKVIDTVSITAGSGSAQKAYLTSFDSAGVKTLSFWLEDSEGKQIASKMVTINVGNVQTEAQGSIIDQINSTANQYAGIILLLIIVAIVVIYWKTRR